MGNHDVKLWKEAAVCIGLPMTLAWKIALAADNEVYGDPNITELRQRLLQHCRLAAA